MPPAPTLQVDGTDWERAGLLSLGPGSLLRPTALFVGMDVRLQRQRRTVSPSPAHEKVPKSQNKGLSRLTSPAQHLAWGLIEGNRASWSESEE